jgi:hypothetical protein
VGGWETFHFSWAIAPKETAQSTEIHSFFMIQKYTKKRVGRRILRWEGGAELDF